MSILDDVSLDALKKAIWRLTGLIRFHVRHDDEIAGEALALRPGSTVTDVAASVHRDLAEQLEGARVWGPSFLGHLPDAVEIADSPSLMP